MSRISQLEINNNLITTLGNASNQYAGLKEYIRNNTLNSREVSYLYTIAIREKNLSLFQVLYEKIELKEKQKEEYLYEAIVKNSFEIAKVLINSGANLNYVQNKNTQRTTLNALANKIPFNQEMMGLFFEKYKWNNAQITLALTEAIKYYAIDSANFLLSKLDNHYKSSHEFKKHILRNILEVANSKNENKENYSTTFSLNFIKSNINTTEFANIGLTLCNESTPLSIYQALIKQGADVNHYQKIKIFKMLTNKTEEENTHMVYNNLTELPKAWNDGKLFVYLKSVGLNQDHQGILNMLFNAHFDVENPFVKWLFDNEPQVVAKIIRKQMQENQYFAVQYGKKLTVLLEKIEVIEEQTQLENSVEVPTALSKKGMKI